LGRKAIAITIDLNFEDRMRAEMQSIAEEIEQSLRLLRRHL
jgi:hypothetical protein